MNKTFGDKLKNARTNAGLKQSELAKTLGVANTTISNWEKNISKPDLEMLSYICGVLNVKVSYFLEAKVPEDEVTLAEFNIIKKYRDLDEHGRKMVDFTLAEEYKRSMALKEKATSVAQDAPPVRLINYYYRLASAGTGQILFDTPPTKRIEIPNIKKYAHADYAIGVNGRSMGPTYNDGDTLLVEMTEEIRIGEIGIFLVNGECYVKKLGENELISLNTDYRNIPLNETARCMGRVIDKL